MEHPRPTKALLAAFLCIAGLAASGAVALIVPVARSRDAATLDGFTNFAGHPRVSALANDIAHLVDPGKYLLIGLVLAAIALLRRRPRVAIAIPLTMFAASLTTELLKPISADSRLSEWFGPHPQINAASWPSGHATAAMMVALCGVLVAPRVLRPLVALLGTGLAVGVSYSILVLGWHFPSDVLGGFLVAGTWVSLAVAALWALDARQGSARPSERIRPTLDLLAPAALLAATFAAALAVLAARGRLVQTYGSAHLSFVAGALLIAGLAAILATTITVALRPRR